MLACDDDAAPLLHAAKEASRQAAEALAVVNAAMEAFARGEGDGPTVDEHSELVHLSRVASACWLLYSQYASMA
jgi:hypothetical protein